MFVRATVLSLLLMAAAATAQITLTADDLPPVGYVYTSGLLMNQTFDAGSGGAAQYWNFGEYNWGQIRTTTFVDPAETPFAASFPTATHSLRDVGGSGDTNWVYLRIAPDAYMMQGMFAADMGTVTVYETEAAVSAMPLAYNTTWTSVARYMVPYQPGLDMLVVDSAASVVDGWGVCTTPYGSTEVLRCFSRHTQTTILADDTMAYTYLNYSWIGPQGVHVVTVTSNLNVTEEDFTTGAISMSGMPLAVEPVRGHVVERFAVGQNYPNPFNPTTNLPVELSKPSHISMDIYDETGRRVASRSYDLPAGEHTLPINGGAWATGTYFARVQAEGFSRTTKMQLVK